MTNAEIFRKAADYIREHGLEQDGSYGRDGGPRCLAGAIFSAYGTDNPLALEPQLVAVCDRLRDSGHSQGYTTWNDAAERTAEDVIAFLDGMAHDEELKEQIATLPAEADKVLEGVSSLS